MASTGSSLTKVLQACERAVWQALVDGDASADEALLAEDFIGIYPTGFATRQDHVEQLGEGPSIAEFALSSIHVTAIDDRNGTISYRADFRRVGNECAEQMYVTSLWSKRDDRWVNTLSQDTPAEPPPRPT